MKLYITSGSFYIEWIIHQKQTLRMVVPVQLASSYFFSRKKCYVVHHHMIMYIKIDKSGLRSLYKFSNFILFISKLIPFTLVHAYTSITFHWLSLWSLQLFAYICIIWKIVLKFIIYFYSVASYIYRVSHRTSVLMQNFS